MPASTSGKPVVPRRQRSNRSPGGSQRGSSLGASSPELFTCSNQSCQQSSSSHFSRPLLGGSANAAAVQSETVISPEAISGERREVASRPGKSRSPA